MPVLNAEARSALTAGRLAHLVTINVDGSPQVRVVWVGVEADEITAERVGGVGPWTESN